MIETAMGTTHSPDARDEGLLRLSQSRFHHKPQGEQRRNQDCALPHWRHRRLLRAIAGTKPSLELPAPRTQ
jgi:hypothetical protein